MDEVYAIREALDYYWFEKAKDLRPYSPVAMKINKAVKPLLDQFKGDIFKA